MWPSYGITIYKTFTTVETLLNTVFISTRTGTSSKPATYKTGCPYVQLRIENDNENSMEIANTDNQKCSSLSCLRFV